MRMLLAALGFAAVAVHTAAAAAPSPQTLYESQPDHLISAFAQDGPVLAWFEASSTDCNAVIVNQIGNGTYIKLPATTTQNVTCRWEVVPPVQLSLAGQNLLWTLREAAPPAPLPFDYVLGAGVGDPNERRFLEIAHAKQGAGLWLGGIAGDSDTLVYAVTSVDYVNEVTCLSDPSLPGACALKIAGGGIHRTVGRSDTLVPQTSAAVAVAAAGTTVAYVPAVAIGKHGQPLAGAHTPIEIRNAATGELIGEVTPRGTPVAIALSSTMLATLERTPLGLRLGWYAPSGGSLGGSVPVPKDASPELSAGARLIVFHVGRSIRCVDVTSGRVRTLAGAASTPIGLSVEGNRVAWAENVKGRGRIRDLIVKG
ncbi:MAG: hypothetical protein ABSB24_13155 [Gaiellaceae bacterium]|jgi:hypothetical protein